MSITQLMMLAGIAIGIGQLKKGRSLALLAASGLIIYWLQPPQSSASLTFWFPTGTLAITGLSWLLTSTPETRGWKQNWGAVAVLLGVIVFVDMNRYFKFEQFFITSTPRFPWVAALVVIVMALTLLVAHVRQFPSVVFVLATLILIVILAFLKMPSVTSMIVEAGTALRQREVAESASISWLGFSYISFRLMHTILDRRAGRLPSVSLADYANYVLFFPSIAAGPIDRIERFVRDLNNPVPLGHADWIEAGRRFFLGSFKKFVIADALAWVALSEAFGVEARSAGWMWILLYAYSLQIYFDFSGYTDIAIGLGRLLGVNLPENFAAPYLKPNLTQFWNSWHITLTQWFRAYFFNPLTRAMRSRENPLPTNLVIFVTQVSTMVLIGLWHGVTVGFALWGLWHGLGLFVQNRWSEFARTRLTFGEGSPGRQMVLRYTGIFLTFNFVSLGWLFFIMPTPESAWTAVLKLLGIS